MQCWCVLLHPVDSSTAIASKWISPLSLCGVCESVDYHGLRTGKPERISRCSFCGINDSIMIIEKL